MPRLPKAPGRELETREQALERLLRVALDLVMGDRDPAEPSALDSDGIGCRVDAALFSEATFWLEFVPRGAKPVATVPEKRLGHEVVTASRVAIARERGTT